MKDAVEVEPVAPLELKGKAERVPAFRPARPDSARRKLNGDARGFVTLPVAFGGGSGK